MGLDYPLLWPERSVNSHRVSRVGRPHAIFFLLLKTRTSPYTSLELAISSPGGYLRITCPWMFSTYGNTGRPQANGDHFNANLNTGVLCVAKRELWLQTSFRTEVSTASPARRSLGPTSSTLELIPSRRAAWPRYSVRGLTNSLHRFTPETLDIVAQSVINLAFSFRHIAGFSATRQRNYIALHCLRLTRLRATPPIFGGCWQRAGPLLIRYSVLHVAFTHSPDNGRSLHRTGQCSVRELTKL